MHPEPTETGARSENPNRLRRNIRKVGVGPEEEGPLANVFAEDVTSVSIDGILKMHGHLGHPPNVALWRVFTRYGKVVTDEQIERAP